jgi:hypothetical protein
VLCAATNVKQQVQALPWTTTSESTSQNTPLYLQGHLLRHFTVVTKTGHEVQASFGFISCC